MSFAPNRNWSKPKLNRYDDWFPELRNKSLRQQQKRGAQQAQQGQKKGARGEGSPGKGAAAEAENTTLAPIPYHLLTKEEALVAEQKRFGELKSLCGLPFIDIAVYEKCVVQRCTSLAEEDLTKHVIKPLRFRRETSNASPAQIQDDPHRAENRRTLQSAGAFTPTIGTLQSLNAALLQQYELSTLAIRLVAHRNAMVFVIRHETCCAALGQLAPKRRRRKHEHEEKELTEEDCCTAATHRRLASLLHQLDRATDDVVTAILLWRRNLSRPVPFMVEGQNYVLRIRKEIDSVIGPCHRHLTRAAKSQGIDMLHHSRLLSSPTEARNTSIAEGRSTEESEFYLSHYLSRTSFDCIPRSPSRTAVLGGVHRRPSTQSIEDSSFGFGDDGYYSGVDDDYVQEDDEGEQNPLQGLFPGSVLISTVFGEHEIQRAYLQEMLLRTAQGRYQLILRPSFVHVNPLTSPPTLGGSAVMGESQEPKTWLPLPLLTLLEKFSDDPVSRTLPPTTTATDGSTSPNTESGNQSPHQQHTEGGTDNFGGGVLRSRYRLGSVVETDGTVPLNVLRSIFRPKAALRTGVASQYGPGFTQQVSRWLTHCYTEGYNKVEGFFDDVAGAEDSDLSSEEGEDEEGAVLEQLSSSVNLLDSDRKARRLQRKLELRQRYRFFQKWLSLSLFRSERRRVAWTLLKHNEKALRRKFWNKFRRWITMHKDHKIVAEELLGRTAEVLLRDRYRTWQHFELIFRLGKSLYAKVYRGPFLVLYQHMLRRKVSRASGEHREYQCLSQPHPRLRHLHCVCYAYPADEERHKLQLQQLFPASKPSTPSSDTKTSPKKKSGDDRGGTSFPKSQTMPPRFYLQLMYNIARKQYPLETREGSAGEEEENNRRSETTCTAPVPKEKDEPVPNQSSKEKEEESAPSRDDDEQQEASAAQEEEQPPSSPPPSQEEKDNSGETGAEAEAEGEDQGHTDGDPEQQGEQEEKDTEKEDGEGEAADPPAPAHQQEPSKETGGIADGEHREETESAPPTAGTGEKEEEAPEGEAPSDA